MAKTPTKTAPKAATACPGCEGKAGGCTDCAPVTPTVQPEAQAIPTPSAGGRYMRAEDGTLTPIKE
jgi:hypothetical protein